MADEVVVAPQSKLEVYIRMFVASIVAGAMAGATTFFATHDLSTIISDMITKKAVETQTVVQTAATETHAAIETAKTEVKAKVEDSQHDVQANVAKEVLAAERAGPANSGASADAPPFAWQVEMEQRLEKLEHPAK